MSGARVLVALLALAACTVSPAPAAPPPPAPPPWAARAAAWGLRDVCDDCATIPVLPVDTGEAGGASLRVSWNGKPTIQYDAPWVWFIGEAYGDSVLVWLYAHELGHYIGSPVGTTRAGRELVADMWAGCALARVGMALEPVEEAMREVISPYPTPTHPAYPARIEAVRHGARVCALEVRVEE